ncbi:hypothetical protein Q427_34285 [Halomonas sp. BC04]|nr:hypothetical protein Q427_34285 [Halomonas sp. BC04]
MIPTLHVQLSCPYLVRHIGSLSTLEAVITGRSEVIS